MLQFRLDAKDAPKFVQSKLTANALAKWNAVLIAFASVATIFIVPCVALDFIVFTD